MPRSPEELARIALDVARGAATLLMGGFRTHPVATEKARANLVTDYDFASERAIRAELHTLTPEIAIVAEEEGGQASTEITWFVDPLDGTTNFVHGHPFFCVSIGALCAGLPIAGAVVAPALRTSWLAYGPGTAQRDGVVCHVSETDELGHALIATGFPSDRSRAPHNNFDSFTRVKSIVRGVRRCGSAAIDMCYVADGTYDGYWERALNAWDLAAGAALVLGAGGQLSALDGGPADLSVGHVLATNGKLHGELLAILT
jgi:myo-inositol-1(or 4)-monophosphatase